MTEDHEFSREEKAAALTETLASDGWRLVIAPYLRHRLDVARGKLETVSLDMEQARVCQAEIRLLRQIVDRPRETFTEGLKL